MPWVEDYYLKRQSTGTYNKANDRQILREKNHLKYLQNHIQHHFWIAILMNNQKKTSYNQKVCFISENNLSIVL